MSHPISYSSMVSWALSSSEGLFELNRGKGGFSASLLYDVNRKREDFTCEMEMLR